MLSIVSVCALVLAACGSTAEESDAPEAEPEQNTELIAGLDCIELGFPCSWQDVPDALRERSALLLSRAGQALDAGEDPFSIAADLLLEEDVVAAVADETGVQLRVDGVPPVVAFDPFTNPVTSAIHSVAQRSVPGDGDEVAAAIGPAPSGVVLAANPTQASGLVSAIETAQVGVTSYETTRDPGVRPRSALLIRPFAVQDAEALFRQLQARGLLPPGVVEPADIDLDLAGFGTTARVLEESEHIRLTRAVDNSSFSQFASHDVVYVQTHSSSFNEARGCDPALGHVCGNVLGGFPFSDEEPAGPESAPGADEMFWPAVGLPVGATIGHVNGWWTTAYTPDFFRQAYSGGSLDSIVVLNGCKSASSDHVLLGLASTASDTAGPAVFGWTDYLDAIKGDISAAVLMDLLVNEGLSTHAAIGLIGAVPALREHTTNDGDMPRLVLGGRDIRARDAVELLDDGFAMEPRAVLQVEGEPEDGVDDHIEELTLRVDGVLVDEKDAAVLTWQLDGRHSEPIRIDNPFEPGEGREVRELDAAQPFGGQGYVDTERWTSYEITLTNVDLQFDVQRDDLISTAEEELRVDLSVGDGRGPSRHEVIPVLLRQGLVEIVEPTLGEPFADEERLLLDGTANDDFPEIFPLIVNLDHIDEAVVDDLVLEVRVGEVELSVPSARWEQLSEGRYRFEQSLFLFDFEEDEVLVDLYAAVELPEIGLVEFTAEQVLLELRPASACDVIGSGDVSAAMGRGFGPGEALTGFAAGICRWSAERSTIEMSLTGADSVAAIRAAVANGEGAIVDGFDDAATYDLLSGNALNPSGIEIDGGMQFTNFVNLSVVIDDATAALIHVQGNIVVEEGPDSGLLDRLQALVTALRDSS